MGAEAVDGVESSGSFNGEEMWDEKKQPMAPTMPKNPAWW